MVQTSKFQFPPGFWLRRHCGPATDKRPVSWLESKTSLVHFLHGFQSQIAGPPGRRTHLLTTWTILPSPAHEPHRYSKVSFWCIVRSFKWAMALKKIVAWNLTWNLTGLPAWSIHLVSSFYQGATLAMMCECVCDPTNLRSEAQRKRSSKRSNIWTQKLSKISLFCDCNSWPKLIAIISAETRCGRHATLMIWDTRAANMHWHHTLASFQGAAIPSGFLGF